MLTFKMLKKFILIIGKIFSAVGWAVASGNRVSVFESYHEYFLVKNNLRNNYCTEKTEIKEKEAQMVHILPTTHLDLYHKNRFIKIRDCFELQLLLARVWIPSRWLGKAFTNSKSISTIDL